MTAQAKVYYQVALTVELKDEVLAPPSQPGDGMARGHANKDVGIREANDVMAMDCNSINSAADEQRF